MSAPLAFSSFFFFNDTATTEIYTLSLHDALPISSLWRSFSKCCSRRRIRSASSAEAGWSLMRRGCCQALPVQPRSEEHTSELQSRLHLVCRLLLEKKKKKTEVLTGQ